ncbi:V-set and immunoglobulin domain-containing protein 10 isoform X4 [Manis javanica]|uniref:V-set and immunoglobulin domain-containing protein 10 isoform X4 n=1 Tax=Manis javanica TaxID=9974 RepID=UPI00187B0C6E|nr:V-set and immunoglobulin domain-containing protein 10 isoform X4 [Manis javanica]
MRISGKAEMGRRGAPAFCRLAAGLRLALLRALRPAAAAGLCGPSRPPTAACRPGGEGAARAPPRCSPRGRAAPPPRAAAVKPSSRPRWRKLGSRQRGRREGAGSCCFPRADAGGGVCPPAPGRALGSEVGAGSRGAAPGPGPRAHSKHPCWGLWKVELLRRSQDLGETLRTPGSAVRGVHTQRSPRSLRSPARVGDEMAAGVRAPAPGVLFCLGALLAGWVAAGLEAVVVGEVHENVTLRCGNISGPRGLVTWYRNDSEPVFLVTSNSSLPPAEPRFSLVNASSLHIGALSLQDEGNYTCREVLSKTRWFPVWLQVASGPYQVEVHISTSGLLPNGTLYAAKGSEVDFNCSSSAWPPPVVEWWFQAPDSSIEPFGNNLTVSCFTLLLMSQNLQGNYTCLAKNVLSGRHRQVTTELLVYSPPPSAPRCWAEMSPGLLMLQLTCRWDGGYPDPDFLWMEEPGGVVVGMSKLGVEMLNQSQLLDGKKFRCVGSHIVGPESGASCVVQIEPLNIGGIVGTIVSLLLLGLAIISGLMFYYSPVFCWKGNTFRGQDMGDIMVLVDSEEEEVEEEDATAEEEVAANEREELPKEIHKHVHIHRVTALVNGNADRMGRGLQALQDDSSEQQNDMVQEDRPV